MTFLEQLLNQLVGLAILLCEYTGVIVITVSSIRGIIEYVRRNPQTRLNLAKGMAMGLEFKVGSEILRTVVVREVQEIFIVASIIALRALLTFLIHWEIKNEEKSGNSEEAAKAVISRE